MEGCAEYSTQPILLRPDIIIDHSTTPDQTQLSAYVEFTLYMNSQISRVHFRTDNYFWGIIITGATTRLVRFICNGLQLEYDDSASCMICMDKTFL